MNYPKRTLNIELLILLYLMFFFILSCSKSTSKGDIARIDKILDTKDTDPYELAINSKLDSIRSLIGKDDIPRLFKFYRLKHRVFRYGTIDLAKVNLYSDSAIFLFKDKSSIPKNKNDYFEALLVKGDALYISKKYSQAVIYFLEALSFREKNLDICFNKSVFERIGNVYYVQNQPLRAARYYKESYELESSCAIDRDFLKHYYDMQALLNNTGFSYEKAEMLDSAKYFYQKDLDYITSCRKLKKIKSNALDDAECIALDNLGSIYMKEGNLLKAEDLLLKSISIKYSGDEGVQIPPLIKLANLYTQKNDYAKADFYFDKSLLRLKNIPNPDLESRWEKARTYFYAKQNKPAQAFLHQQNYILLRDSVNKEQLKLSSINVEKDFANLEQRYVLQDLEKKDTIKNIYLILTISVLISVLVILFLFQRNVKQSKKNNLLIKLNNDELQESLLKLEDVNQNYARIMKVMAHDLKNPLNGISHISSILLEENSVPNKEKSSIAVIKESAENALGMVNEILNSFLFVVGKPKMKRENINIQLVLEQCVSMLKFKAEDKGQRIIYTATNELIIHANKEKLWRVFNNLIVNAIKFSPKNKSIIISIKEVSRYVIVAISDQGIGIPEESAEKIYDIFTEAKRTGTEGEKAYGLGLSISKQIVEAHFGKIWFESKPSGGTTFFVQLPK